MEIFEQSDYDALIKHLKERLKELLLLKKPTKEDVDNISALREKIEEFERDKAKEQN